jgi:hypothetical protein
VLVIAAIVVGRWEVIRNYWDRITRGVSSESIALRAISSDTEYFCPMDPGIVSDWPSKCGICNMALVRRKRGEAVALPNGVVARMQLSPYRIVLAGIRTTPAAFRPLLRELQSSGVVTRERDVASVLLELAARQASWVSEGQAAEISILDRPGSESLGGRVRSVARNDSGGWEHILVKVAFDHSPNTVRSGMLAAVKVRAPLAELDPFRTLQAEIPPMKSGEPRRVYACPDHAAKIAIKPGRCPIDQNPREPRTLDEHQRVRWWCPMHPDITAEKPGAVCSACGGMELEPRVVSYHPAGQVLCVPRSAVVDTSTGKVVFVETMPGMFDGVEVVLGPRSGEFDSVVRGLEAGQKVATAGAFLLDAETRLNPSLAAGYFGANRGERTTSVQPRTKTREAVSPVAAALEELAPADRSLAERQKVCPVTNQPLGSMGAPARMVVSGQVVFLCCSGCEGKVKKEPAKYLAKLSGSNRP